MKMLKPTRSRARIAITLAAVLLAYAGIRLAHWRLRPLGASPPVEFPRSAMSQSEVLQFLGGDFRIVKDMKALPRPVIEAFTETGGSRLTVANPGQRFQATDHVLDESLPWKRLLFAGVLGERCFMLYEQGGRAHFYVLALFKLTPAGAIQPIWQGSCEPAADIAELRSKVSTGLCSQPIPSRRVLHVWDH
jgi:hypothetical protein